MHVSNQHTQTVHVSTQCTQTVYVSTQHTQTVHVSPLIPRDSQHYLCYASEFFTEGAQHWALLWLHVVVELRFNCSTLDIQQHGGKFNCNVRTEHDLVHRPIDKCSIDTLETRSFAKTICLTYFLCLPRPLFLPASRFEVNDADIVENLICL